MAFTARYISELLGGELVGNPEVIIEGPAKIEEAGPGQISFLGNPKYEPYLYQSKASAILVEKNFESIMPVSSTLIKVDNVYQKLSTLMALFDENPSKCQKGISNLAFISEKATIGQNTSVGNFCVIKEGAIIGNNNCILDQVYIGENVVIGNNCLIYPGVKIHHNTVIGNNCIIHSNAVIGSDGFGFSMNAEGRYDKIAQLGKVVIGNDVEIGACTSIDRASMGETIIADGVKLDNLIQIAHNVRVGENTAIAAQSGIAGSTEIGAHCMIGGQVGIVGHIKVADRVIIQAKSGVASNVCKEGSKLYGYPAIDYQRYLKSYAYFKSFSEIVDKIRQLEKELDYLKNKEV